MTHQDLHALYDDLSRKFAQIRDDQLQLAVDMKVMRERMDKLEKHEDDFLDMLKDTAKIIDNLVTRI